MATGKSNCSNNWTRVSPLRNLGLALVVSFMLLCTVARIEYCYGHPDPMQEMSEMLFIKHQIDHLKHKPREEAANAIFQRRLRSDT